MVKVPEVAAALSDVDGRDVEAIEWVARCLREAGSLPSNGRGNPLADLTARDAVNLLFALNGSDNARDAAKHVEHFRALVPTPFGKACHFPARDVQDRLARPLLAAATFGAAVEYLIDNCLPYAAWLTAFVPEKIKRDRLGYAKHFGADLQVQLVRVGAMPTTGIIRLYHHDRARGRYHVDLEQHYGIAGERVEDAYRLNPAQDRSVMGSFGIRTLATAFVALYGEAEDA
jgi:hypothetical protein